MEIFSPIWKGLLTGFMFTMTFGTVFFSLLQTSIKYGLRKSIYIVCGVIVSDALYISISVFGSTFLIDSIRHYDHVIRVVGFFIIAFLGIYTIMKHSHLSDDEIVVQEKGAWLYAFKGLMLNSINPMTFIGWIGVATYVETVNRFSLPETCLFFGMALATMGFTMFWICYFARKLKNILSDNNLHRLNILIGIAFIIFALIIVWPVTGFGTL